MYKILIASLLILCDLAALREISGTMQPKCRMQLQASNKFIPANFLIDILIQGSLQFQHLYNRT